MAWHEHQAGPCPCLRTSTRLAACLDERQDWPHVLSRTPRRPGWTMSWHEQHVLAQHVLARTPGWPAACLNTRLAACLGTSASHVLARTPQWTACLGTNTRLAHVLARRQDWPHVLAQAPGWPHVLGRTRLAACLDKHHAACLGTNTASLVLARTPGKAAWPMSWQESQTGHMSWHKHQAGPLRTPGWPACLGTNTVWPPAHVLARTPAGPVLARTPGWPIWPRVTSIRLAACLGTNTRLAHVLARTTCWPAWCSCQGMLASLVFLPNGQPGVRAKTC